MEVYIGVDWSATEVVCAVGTKRESDFVEKSGPTYLEVCALLERIRTRYGDTADIKVIIESGHQGWATWFHFAGATVFIVDGKQATRFAESLSSSKAKDDMRDAKTLLLYGFERCDGLPHWQPKSDTQRSVELLVRRLEKLTSQQTAAKNRVRAFLRENYAPIDSEITDISAAWVRRLLLACPTPWHAKRLTRAELDLLMKGTRHQKRDRVWDAIQKSKLPFVSQELSEMFAFDLEILLEELARCVDAISRVNKRLDDVTSDLDARHLMEGVAGIATKMASKMMAYAFDETPKDRDQAATKLGVNPVFRGSGKTRNGNPKGTVVMRRSVNGLSHATGYMLGRLASQQLNWAKARLAYDLSRGKSAAHSYRIIARSLCRILTAMLKNNEPYDNARYVRRLKNMGNEWAKDLEIC